MKGYGAGTVFPVTRIRDGKPVTVHVGQWERPRIEGKRRRGSVSGATAAEAWRLMRAAQRAEGRNSRSPRSTESVGAFLERWLDDVVRTTRRERTLVGYRTILRGLPDGLVSADLLDPHLGHEVQAWLNGLELHPRTIDHYAACLRAAFTYAVRKGLMDRNPAADLDLPAIPRTERIPLTAAELRAFLAAADGPLVPLWTTAAWTGLRSGELLGLRWEDVSLERAMLVVRQSLTRLPGRTPSAPLRYVLTEPKTAKSRRSVPLVPEVVAVLRPMRKDYLRQPPSLDQGLVFATAAGSPLDGPWVSRQFMLTLARAGTRRVRLHDLRHGTASLLIEAGVDLATISAILGHSNIGTTVDLYGHLTEQHKVAAMARMSAHG